MSPLRARAVALAGALIWLLAHLSLGPGSEAGDAYAVYFPIVQNFSGGLGAESFLPAMSGVARMPLYPLALWAVSVLTGDLIYAAQALGVLSAFAVLWSMLRLSRGGVATLVATVRTAVPGIILSMIP